MPDAATLPDLGSPANLNAAYERRKAHYEALLDRLREREVQIKLGGGAKRIQREHDRGKLTARERIA
ncbi:MAG: hypothetical protein AAFN13_19360, partial [Bacteroidota bacterium]